MPCYTFGSFSLDPEARVLLRDGEPVPLAGKTFDTLLALVQNRGRLMLKDELLAKVWPGTAVEEANLSQNIFAIRKVLGDSPKDHHYIATVAGRGYQFVAPVTEADGAAPGPVSETKARPFWPQKRIIWIGTLAVSVGLIAVAWFTVHKAAQPAPELIQRRLTFNSSENPVESAVLSPDGSYLAYSGRAGIHVKLLSTGEERLLPTPGGTPAGTLAYVDSWFPDGTQLLVHSKQPDDHGNMWTISAMGESPRELRRDASGWQVSPDGTRIVFSPKEHFGFDSFHEIWVMDSQGENARKILGLEPNEWFRSVRWSPDGQRLAYVRIQYPPDKHLQFVETCDLNGANRTAILVEPAAAPHLQDIAWLSDGRIIYSRIERHDSNGADLWEVDVDTKQGTATGKPKRITRWAGSNLLGLSASANGKRIVLQTVTSRGQVYLGELASGGTPRGPWRLTENDANDFASAWTADSNTLVLISDRDGKPLLFKQSISGSEAKPLITGQKEAAYLARLSPDGAWVLYMESTWSPGAEPDPLYRLMRVPVSGGLPQFVLETRNWRDFQCSRAPADRCVIVEQSEDAKRLVLTAFDPLKGRGKLLKTIETSPYYRGTGMSPDGSIFAIAIGGEVDPRICLLSLSGGSDREITVRGWPNILGLDWSADGKGFYCGSISPEGAALLFVDLNGTARMLWHDKGPGVIGIPSPNGRYLAIGATVHNSNAWMLEGF